MADHERSGTSGQHEPPRCLWCESTSLNLTSWNSVRFYECPRCDRRYKKTPEGELIEPWSDAALRTVLYGVIFEKHPQQAVEWIANQVDHRNCNFLLSEIDRELNQPSRPVRGIVDALATEEDLREFLGLVAIELRKRQE